MKIHYISPYSIEKKFGDSINGAIARLNPDVDDWICLRDGDVAFLTPDWGNTIEKAVCNYGHIYSLIGCLTNRLGGVYQCAGDFSEMNLAKHYQTALDLKTPIEDGWVCDFKHDIAGFFMLFSVKIWNKVRFKNSIVFDRDFTAGVRRNGGKVGIMPGLYVLHCYRLWETDRKQAQMNSKHLL